jgi:hypothetical protein
MWVLTERPTFPTSVTRGGCQRWARVTRAARRRTSAICCLTFR